MICFASSLIKIRNARLVRISNARIGIAFRVVNAAAISEGICFIATVTCSLMGITPRCTILLPAILISTFILLSILIQADPHKRVKF